MDGKKPEIRDKTIRAYNLNGKIMTQRTKLHDFIKKEIRRCENSGERPDEEEFYVLLKQFKDMTDSYRDLVEEISSYDEQKAASLSLMQNCFRHTTEANQIKEEFSDLKFRHELLHSKQMSSKEIDAQSKALRLEKTPMDIVLDEHNSAQSSHSMVDDHITLLLETRERLHEQRHLMKSIQSRMNNMLSHFPQVNSLVQRINARKRLDSCILGIVIAAALFFIIFF